MRVAEKIRKHTKDGWVVCTDVYGGCIVSLSAHAEVVRHAIHVVGMLDHEMPYV